MYRSIHRYTKGLVSFRILKPKTEISHQQRRENQPIGKYSYQSFTLHTIKQSKMSSQICNAKEIHNSNLIACCNKTTNKFCENHEHRYRFEKPEECPICFEEISRETETPLECGHWLHRACIVPSNLHKCSLCQSKMTQPEIDFIFGQGHREENNFNDGTSIFWHASQEIEDAYEEFGHAQYDSDDEQEDEGLSNETSAETILFTRNFDNATHDDIVGVLFDLKDHMNSIINSFILEQSGSQFVFRRSLLTSIPDEDMSIFRTFLRGIIVRKCNEIANGNNGVLPLDFKLQVGRNLLEQPHIDMFVILFNFMRLRDENFMIQPINTVELTINNMIIGIFNHLFNQAN